MCAGENKSAVFSIKKIWAEIATPKKEKMRNFILGPVQMVVSSVFVSLMVYFAKLATQTVPSPELTFFRLALGALVALLMVKRNGNQLITANARLLVVRGFFGGVTVLLFFMGIEQGTVTNSMVLQNTFPLFAVLLSFYLLKEKVTIQSFSYLMIAFIGIVLLIRPNFSNIKTGDLLALASGVVGGFAMTAIRQLRKNNESVWTIFFYFCIFGAVISFGLALPQWQWPKDGAWVWIVLTALSGLISQLTMTSAYKYCSTILGGVLNMSSSIFSFVIGVLILNETVGFLDLTGILLIISGSILIVIYEDAHSGQKREQQVANFPER